MTPGCWMNSRVGSARRCWGTVCLLLCLLLLSPWALAGARDGITAREYEVKAAYLFRFMAFIHTTREHQGTGTVHKAVRSIAIIGDDPFGQSFAPVESGVAPGRGMSVRVDRFAGAPPSELPGDCLIAFFCTSEKERVADHLAACRGMSILTVSDMDGFLEAGGMMRLLKVGDRVRWEINRAALDAAGLVLDAQLLRNAVRVTRPVPRAETRQDER